MAPFIEAERKAGVATAGTNYVLFQDILDSQKQPNYIQKLKDLGFYNLDFYFKNQIRNPRAKKPWDDDQLGGAKKACHSG